MLDDQKGKVAIVTGSNTGIGEVTARELARAGAKVYMACRSAEKATEAMARIRTDVPDADIHFMKLDLASLAAVRVAAEDFLAREEPLPLLINNAGLAGQRGQTREGFELAFGVNHLGHFLLTLLLLPRIVESAPARIVTVASKAHYRATEIDWDRLREPTRSTTGWPEYQVSKLANVLFSNELHRRLEGTGVSTYAVHPGVVASDIWRRIPWPFSVAAKAFMISNEEGANTTLHCAWGSEMADVSGRYWSGYEVPKSRGGGRRYFRPAQVEPSRLARDEALAAELWRRSLEWTGAPDYPEKTVL